MSGAAIIVGCVVAVIVWGVLIPCELAAFWSAGCGARHRDLLS